MEHSNVRKKGSDVRKKVLLWGVLKIELLKSDPLVEIHIHSSVQNAMPVAHR